MRDGDTLRSVRSEDLAAALRRCEPWWRKGWRLVRPTLPWIALWIVAGVAVTSAVGWWYLDSGEWTGESP